jgi:hypothetical protein
MRKKRDPGSVEIVPLTPAEKTAGSTIAIARMIEGLVEKALSGTGADLEPFFGTAEVSYEVKRRQTVQQNSKFQFYFEDWGCMLCGTREAAHGSLGMCRRCYNRVKMRLAKSLRKRQPKEPAEPKWRDAAELAREALAPHLRPRRYLPRKSN